MIAYCMTRDPNSMLCQVQQRLWRDLDPQVEFVSVVTRDFFCQIDVDQCMNDLKGSGHRYLVCFHEDCIPLQRMDPVTVLRGKTYAGRVSPDGKHPHPSRTWIMADCETEGQTASYYAERRANKDDFPDIPEELVGVSQFLEPGWLHVHKWWKVGENDPLRQVKRDWVQQRYEKYLKMPKLTSRIKSFAIAAGGHAMSGAPNVTPAQWIERREICKQCDYFKDNRCLKCGCGILTKSKWAGQDCPIGKWPILVEPSIGASND